MRILFEVLLIIIIALFAYKAFIWLFPKEKKGRKLEEKENVIEGTVVKEGAKENK